MLDDRTRKTAPANLSSHVYRGEVAEEIYQRVRAHAPRLREAYDVVRGLP